MRQVKCVSYIDGSCKLVYSNATKTAFNVSRETISDEDFQPDDLLKHIQDAQRLAKVHLIDLALSNRWNWFITITLSPKLYSLDRHVQAVYDLRSAFNRFHVPFVFVPEYHKSGRVHMHCLANLNDFHKNVFHLIESCNPHNGLPVRTKYNQIIYNSCYFAEYFGHNAFVPIPTVEASVNMAKYVAKYITKTMHKIGTAYYYRSRNLNNPNYYKAYITKDDILKSLDSFDDYYINHEGVNVKDIGDTYRYVSVTDNIAGLSLLTQEELEALKAKYLVPNYPVVDIDKLSEVFNWQSFMVVFNRFWNSYQSVAFVSAVTALFFSFVTIILLLKLRR